MANNERPIKKIFIAGLPNTGKSLIFSNLTGQYTPSANSPLTTIELLHERIELNGTGYTVYDTPGLHSLYIHSEEELIVREAIFSEEPDIIIQCVDAVRLKQSLTLTLDLFPLEIPMVISLNSIDETGRRGVWINSKELSHQLGIPVIESMAVDGRGIKELKGAIPRARCGNSEISYGDIINSGLNKISTLLPEEIRYKNAVALLLLLSDPLIDDYIGKFNGSKASEELNLAVEGVLRQFRGQVSRFINNKRGRRIDEIAQKVVKSQEITPARSAQTFARMCRHPIFGIPIFLFCLLIMYFLVVDVAGVVSLWMERIFWLPVDTFIDHGLPGGILKTFLIGEYGVLSLGVSNALLTILPILSVFFLFFSTLEDIGYIPNLTVLAKRVFEKLGLSGSAVFPLILALGCKTMATLTTKSISSKKERYIAIFLIAIGVPCAAQLGINLSILGRKGVHVLLFTFALLGLVDLVIGITLNRFLKEDEASSFLMELPPLRWPTPMAVLKKTRYRLYWFLKEAMPVFIITAMVFFIFDEIGVLAVLRTILSPVIQGFLGFPPEMLDVIIVCIARHEVAAAMIINLIEKELLNNVQSIVAVMITMMIPCLANVGAVVKELGGRKAFVMSLSIYVLAILVAGALNQTLVLFSGIV
ncbi:MAG: ferrous iron transporter B [Candidatus Adiutricales bacterium]